ncbi:MAG: dihydroorotase [Opitutales bacterium]|jgi:dihydroorotase
MKSLLVLNATIVNEGTLEERDLLVREGRIERIEGDLSSITADEVIDASGHHLLPGLIDDQVHFREPGLTHKGTIASESRAAVAGGVTSYMEMPNVSPSTTNMDRLREKLSIASHDSLANYAFYLGAANDNLEDIKTAPPSEIAGIKVFMGSSTGNMLVDDESTLENLFRHAPTLIAAHCEHTPTILENEAIARAEHGENVPFHLHAEIRSREACIRSSAMAIQLAQRHGARLHVLHLTTEEEIELFETGPVKEKKITAEACVHHLFLDNSSYVERGPQIKCNPAVKSATDREALLRALHDDRIDVVASDHAPHTWEEKKGKYFDCPSGLPLIQHSLPILLELHRAGKISLETIASKTSHAVADLFQIEDRGYLREGYWADFVLVDLNKPRPVIKDHLLSQCGWSPFAGDTFGASVETTVVSGRVAWRKGRIHEATRGLALSFER